MYATPGQEVYHYNDITWVSCRLKSSATQLFIPQFVETNNKGKGQSPALLAPLWFPSPTVNIAEYVSMS